jgi:hypothetical protein
MVGSLHCNGTRGSRPGLTKDGELSNRSVWRKQCRQYYL